MLELILSRTRLPNAAPGKEATGGLLHKGRQLALMTLLRVTGGELSSCSQLDTNRSAQLLDAARSLGEDEAAAATAVAATAAGAPSWHMSCLSCPLRTLPVGRGLRHL